MTQNQPQSEKRRLLISIIISFSIFAVASVLHLISPKVMHEPDSWGYYYATTNFAQGQWSIHPKNHTDQVEEAKNNGGDLLHYVEFYPDIWENHRWEGMWFFEKAPGYPMLLSWWHKLGIALLFPILLGLATTAMLFVIGELVYPKRYGGLLANILFWANPLTLIMFHRVYMPSFAGLAFYISGACLLFIHIYLQHKLSKSQNTGILLLSGTSLALSCMIVFSNILLIIPLAVFLLFKGKPGLVHKFAWIAPMIWAIFILGIYHVYLFNTPLKTGYSFSPYETGNVLAFMSMSTTETINIISKNLGNIPYYLIGVLPAIFIITVGIFFKRKPIKNYPQRSVFVTLGLMVLAIFASLVFFAWTADNIYASFGILRAVLISRYYLPLIFPIAIIGAGIALRIPKNLRNILIIYLVMFSLLGYFQYNAKALQHQDNKMTIYRNR